MDVFSLRDPLVLVEDYADYIRSFINIKDERIGATVASEMDAGLVWPEPLLQRLCGVRARPDQTILPPPPADTSVAHPAREAKKSIN